MLDVTLAYNESDWTAGYFGDIGGYIAFFTAPGQHTELRDIRTRVVLRLDFITILKCHYL